MLNISELQGSIVALVTPFSNDGSIDYIALEELIKFHLINNTNAIVICGTTGEASTLSENEYAKIIKFTSSLVKDKLLLIAGSGTNSTKQSVKLSQIAVNAGADALLVVSPYYNKPNPNGMYAHYQSIAEGVNSSIILYNVPSRTGSSISPDMCLKLAKDFKNIIGIKEASGGLDNAMDILNACNNKFKVFSGDDMLAVAMIAMGANGCISVAANIIPKEFSKMINAAIEGDLINARKIHYRYLKLMKLNFIESNPVPVKSALWKMKKIKNQFRLPLAPMSSADNLNKLESEMISQGLL